LALVDPRPPARRRSPSRSTPTTRMRQLADRLRDLRVASQLTVEAVAEHLLVSPSKISRLETAGRRASARDVRDLCSLYGVSAEECERLMDLAAKSKETTWYQSADVEAEYRTFIGLEEAASEISTYQTWVMPGLLQTQDYARALLSGLRPPGYMSRERIDDLIDSRMRRQALLRAESPPVLHAVFDEGACGRPIGGPSVMRAQVEHLIDAASLSNVTVQVIPREVGAHPGLDGRFTVLHFADKGLRDTVYIEGLIGELFLDKESDVGRYLEIFGYLTESVALDVVASLARLEAIRKDWISIST